MPFLNRCLQVLFPPAQLALILGIPPTQVHKHGSLGCIDVKNVLEPLEFILPKREVPIPVMDLSDNLSSLTTQEPEAKLQEKLSVPDQRSAETKPPFNPEITMEPSTEEPTAHQPTDTTDTPPKDADLDNMEDFLSA